MYYLYVSANKIYLEALCRSPKSGSIAESGAPCKLVVESGAPETFRSFSWASRTGPVVWYVSDFYLTPDTEMCEYAQILDIRCDTVNGNAFPTTSSLSASG